jgi:ZIP family zinc transporter
LIQTLVFAVGTASAILAGAALGSFWEPPKRLQGALLAFAGGALVTALAFELFQPAERETGLLTAALALVAGATAFIAVDFLLEKKVGGREAVGFALVASVTLDGVPENVALGVTLSDQGSYALLVAIIASNLPQAFGGAATLVEEEGSRLQAFGIWAVVAVLLVVALVGGRVLGTSASDGTAAIFLALAAGAVLASIADTILPEAFHEGGPLIGFATTAGFLTAYALSA